MAVAPALANENETAILGSEKPRVRMPHGGEHPHPVNFRSADPAAHAQVLPEFGYNAAFGSVLLDISGAVSGSGTAVYRAGERRTAARRSDTYRPGSAKDRPAAIRRTAPPASCRVELGPSHKVRQRSFLR